ncbi:MAG: hypothetical protein JNL77_06995 [Nitrosomonas sp.]|nr:hypothetical protein [Nitrosomonas sp.]
MDRRDMTYYTSALAPLFAPSIAGLPEPELVFKTNFGPGVSLSKQPMIGTPGDPNHLPDPIPGNWIQRYIDVVGTDSYEFNLQTAIKAHFGPQTQFIIQQLPMVNLAEYDITSATAKLESMFDAAIQPTTIPADRPDTARELYLRLIQRNPAFPLTTPIQEPLQILRRRDDYATTNAIPIPELPSIAWRFKCELDPNLNNLQANDSDYMIFTEFKKGDLRTALPSGPFSSSVGSYRFVVRILKGSSGLYFSTVLDNVAGSYLIYPVDYNPQPGFIFCPYNTGLFPISVGNMVKGVSSNAVAEVKFSEKRVGTIGLNAKGVLVLNEIKGQPFNFNSTENLQVSSNNGVTWSNACTVPNFWSGHESRQLSIPEEKYRLFNTPGGSVPLGVPLQIEVRCVTPLGGRTDITTGITQAMMTNLRTGEKTVLCNFIGGIQTGAIAGDVTTRILPIEPYSSINTGSLIMNVAHRITDLEFYSDYHIDMI